MANEVKPGDNNAKYAIDDELQYQHPETGAKFKGKVVSISNQEDVDGIRHTYKYIIDTGRIERSADGVDHMITHTINSSHVLKKL